MEKIFYIRNKNMCVTVLNKKMKLYKEIIEPARLYI